MDRPRKTSSLLAAMALVAATAPGLALTRGLPEYLCTSEIVFINHRNEVGASGGRTYGGWQMNSEGRSFSPVGRPVRERTSYWLGHIPYWAGPCLACWSVATMALGFRPRRPVSCPGTAAGLAVAVALVAHAIQCLRHPISYSTSLSKLIEHHHAITSYYWITLPRVAGYTVVAWWLALALGGRWSPEPGARARLGMALGWCWIAIAAASEVGVWCYALNY